MVTRSLNQIRSSRSIRGFRSAAHSTGFASAPVQPLWEQSRMARAEQTRQAWFHRTEPVAQPAPAPETTESVAEPAPVPGRGERE